MPRPDKKAQKIAFKILGVPANMQKKHMSEDQYRVERRLRFEETIRVR